MPPRFIATRFNATLVGVRDEDAVLLVVMDRLISRYDQEFSLREV